VYKWTRVSQQAHFIQNDRFDPLHYAETEQQLFDKLSPIASQLNSTGKAVVNVEHQGQLHSSNIDVKTWFSVLAPFWDGLSSVLSKADQAYIQMNNAFESAAFNLNEKPNVHLLDDIVLRDDVSHLQEKEADGSLNYVTQLSVTGIEVIGEAESSVSVVSKQDSVVMPESVDASATQKGKPSVDVSVSGATHLMQAGIAISIEHCELKTDNSLLTLHACSNGNAQGLLEAGDVFVIGDQSRKQLRPNDRLGSHFGDGVITVIQVV